MWVVCSGTFSATISSDVVPLPFSELAPARMRAFLTLSSVSVNLSYFPCLSF